MGLQKSKINLYHVENDLLLKSKLLTSAQDIQTYIKRELFL